MRSAIPRSVVALILAVTATPGRAAQPADADAPRVIPLILQPSRLDTGADLSLSSSPAERKGGDGALFYSKAVEALPRNLNMNKVWDCVQTPLGRMSLADAEAILQQTQATLQFIDQGVLRRECDWPPFDPGNPSANLAAYRQLAALVCVKARDEMLRSRYGEAVGTIRTGLSMAAHIGNAPSVTQSLTGIAMAKMMLQQLEDIVQLSNSPNLYAAIKALPNPLIDVNVPIANEQNDPSVRILSMSRAAQRQLNEIYDGCRRLTRQLDAEIAALRCIEALRDYAATHDRQLPAQLSDISDVQLPNDPATGKPFAYRLEGSKAILEVAPPRGGIPSEGLRYEITIAP
jgi:hypothetical protein